MDTKIYTIEGNKTKMGVSSRSILKISKAKWEKGKLAIKTWKKERPINLKAKGHIGKGDN